MMDCINIPLSSHNNRRGLWWRVHHRFQFPVLLHLHYHTFTHLHIRPYTHTPEPMECQWIVQWSTLKVYYGYTIRMVIFFMSGKCAHADQLNTHFKIRTYFPHEILSMCWNIKMKFINIFTRNSISNSCFIHRTERISIHAHLNHWFDAIAFHSFFFWFSILWNHQLISKCLSRFSRLKTFIIPKRRL